MTTKSPSRLSHALIVALLLLATAAYLLKMAYLHVLPGSLIALLLLLMGTWYLRHYRQTQPPFAVLASLFAATQVDLWGNFFHMYGQPFGPMQYDEFAHLVGSGLTVPALVWLLREAARRGDYRLPLGLITVLAVSLSFSAAALYEIIELWDELYFGGKRIWTLHDTSNDLQMDLTGKLVGATITYLVMRGNSLPAHNRVC
jgi:uncharacterized membrane protein YjdF